MIRRKTAIKHTIPVARRRKAGMRKGPEGIPAEEWRNEGFLAFLRAEGWCVACLTIMPAFGFGRTIQPMHGPVNGMSSKGPDSGAIPGCTIHHAEQHRIGWPAFERKYGFSREKEAAKWYKAYWDASKT